MRLTTKVTTACAPLQYVSVSPNSGLLKPGVSQACKVTFTALGPPSFFDIDLVCEVGEGSSSSHVCGYLFVEEHSTLLLSV